MRYFLSAGEASGDLHASQLIKELRRRDSDASFRFLGGRRQAEAAGTDPVISIEEMSVMGFAEVLKKLPRILGHLKKAKSVIENWRPDAVILIDYPSFNLKLAKFAKSLGIKVYWYISPKVWVWKEYRVKAMKSYIDRLFCILPFEKTYFKDKHGWEVEYVGNPSVEEIGLFLDTHRPIKEKNKPVLALLPGSRAKEIMSNLPIMAEVASRIKSYHPIIATVPEIGKDLYERLAPGIERMGNNSFNLLATAEAALVTSGTATLETALFGVPQVMMYRHSGSALVYKLFRRLLKVKYFSLPNLITDDETIEELVMHFCTPDSVEKSLRDILPGGKKHETQQHSYKKMREKLGTGEPSSEVAKVIVKDFDKKSPKILGE